MHLPQCLSLDDYLANESTFAEQLRSGTYTGPIPLLNYAPLHQLRDNTLVRFRGMIQDMLDPEIYLERYEVRSGETGVRVQDGRYRDVLERKPHETVDFENASNVNGERRSLFLVSVPGLNDWAACAEREFSGVDTMFERPQQLNTTAAAASETLANCSMKRPHSDDAEPTVGDAAIDGTKRSNVNGNAPSTTTKTGLLSAQYMLNSPLPDRPSKACLAKVYDSFDDFQLDTVIEVIGFLSVNPVLDASTHPLNDDDDDAAADPFRDAAEVQASNPPPSLVPRLHCVQVRPLRHLNPLLNAEGTQPTGPKDGTSAEEMSLEAVYADLQLALTQCLFGDALAAEYLMCNLISTVYVRSEMQTIGQFALNLSNIPASVLPEYTQELYTVLESLLPVSHMLPLTLDNLNTLQFEPKKDYKTNKLTSCVLQLAPHTHLVLDETRLLAGRLEPSGVAAVQTIAHLIQQQQLRADFQFYRLEFPANVAVLCLSEGKSMLPSNCHVPLRPADDQAVAQIRETLAAARQFLLAKLPAIRRRLTQLRVTEFDMTAECLEKIQSDFVEMRRGSAKAGPDDLHALLVLSRLLGLCQGGRQLDGSMWERAKRLEAERRGRLAAEAV